MIIIDKLCYYSKLRYHNPYIKTAWAIMALIVTVSTRSVTLSVLILAAMSYLTVIKGGTNLRRYCHFMAIPFAFLFLSSFAIAANLSKTPLSVLSLPIGSWYLTASFSGLYLVLQLILTALASVSCLYFLTLSTPMPDILMVLKKVRCPYLIIEMMMLIYRFIFVLLDIAYQLRISQICRLGNKDKKTSWKALGELMAILLVRAMKRANEMYDAMESRCYNGVISVLEETNTATKKEITLLVIFSLCLIAAALCCAYLGI
ncbi:MAG TPA: cobalt ECF transporter T component CbiQ [Clostridiales bacterium]|nr:cobalt ECF transporter T component CbiQ [Clostridiales bacterium]